MVEIMHAIVISGTTKAILLVKYIAMSCDEVISVDNQSWISLHSYVIQGWMQALILVTLRRVVDGSNATN
jgi:hypothetical protein